MTFHAGSSRSHVCRWFLECSVLMVLFLVAFVTSHYDNSPDSSTAESRHDQYGVDVSFPIHHSVAKFQDTNSVHAQRYRKTMEGCYKAYSSRECDATERARIDMCLTQPRSQHNYTEIGFKKMRVPSLIWGDILRFWEENKEKEVMEDWPPGNTYVNNWESPSYMVSFENAQLRGGMDLKNRIWEAVKPIISEWTGGKTLVETSLYGIRVYRPEAILATHVDRLPLVSSAIIQVAQDLDEPWPVEVYDHAGKAYNVTMLPGDMVLYESHTVLHGRPFPLKGRFYANIFVHFKPVDHDAINEVEQAERASETMTGKMAARVKKLFSPRRKLEKISGHEQTNHNPEDLRRHKDAIDSEREGKDEEEEEYMKMSKDGRTALHIAASRGDLAMAQHLLGAVGQVEGSVSDSESDILYARDVNDWQAVHEAARGGHLSVLVYLVNHGADLTSKTKGGGSVLYWASRSLYDDHPVIKYLKDHHAPYTEEKINTSK